MPLDSEWRPKDPKRATAQAVAGQGAVKKANYARFFWPILRGMTLIVALWAFVAFLRVFLYGGEWETAVAVYIVTSLALIAITAKQETLPACGGDRSLRRSLLRLPWPITAYCGITGIGYTWVCVFLWYSRRYPFLSCPVVSAMGLILVLYAVIALVVAWLTGGNWRTGLMTFGIALCAPSIIVLRLHLLR
jgi:hypothetical protein